MAGAAGGGGTKATPFQTTNRQDGASGITLHSITAMPQYENKSFEELRFEDYSQGNKGSGGATQPSTTGGFGTFGSPAPAPSGLFGSAAPAPFGAPAPTPGGFGGFGGTPAPAAFGSPAPTPGAFGAPASGAFGSTNSAFGANPQSTPGLFGAPAPTPSSAFGAPAPTTPSLFGSTTPAPFGASAPTPSTGAFGAPAPGAPSLFGAPSPGAFGAPAPTAGSLFGAPPSAPSNFGGGKFDHEWPLVLPLLFSTRFSQPLHFIDKQPHLLPGGSDLVLPPHLRVLEVLEVTRRRRPLGLQPQEVLGGLDRRQARLLAPLHLRLVFSDSRPLHQVEAFSDSHQLLLPHSVGLALHRLPLLLLR